jgi:hypothetical protein
MPEANIETNILSALDGIIVGCTTSNYLRADRLMCFVIEQLGRVNHLSEAEQINDKLTEIIEKSGYHSRGLAIEAKVELANKDRSLAVPVVKELAKIMALRYPAYTSSVADKMLHRMLDVHPDTIVPLTETLVPAYISDNARLARGAEVLMASVYGHAHPARTTVLVDQLTSGVNTAGAHEIRNILQPITNALTGNGGLWGIANLAARMTQIALNTGENWTIRVSSLLVMHVAIANGLAGPANDTGELMMAIAARDPCWQVRKIALWVLEVGYRTSRIKTTPDLVNSHLARVARHPMKRDPAWQVQCAHFRALSAALGQRSVGALKRHTRREIMLRSNPAEEVWVEKRELMCQLSTRTFRMRQAILNRLPLQ